MAIGEKIREYRLEAGMSQRQFAERICVDRSLVAKAERGMKLSETHDAAISRVSWKLALAIANERTNGYISFALNEDPNIDLHPSALKELLMKDLDEARQELGELILAKHFDTEKRKNQAIKIWMELKDVENRSAVLRGVIEERFGLDGERLVERHKQETKEGKR